MGEKSGEERKTEPSLELPSIFGRRKKRRGTEPDDAGRAAVAEPPSVITDEPPSTSAGQVRAEREGPVHASAGIESPRGTEPDGAAELPGRGAPADARGRESDAEPTVEVDAAAVNGTAGTGSPEGPTGAPDAEVTRPLPEVEPSRRQDTSTAPGAVETGASLQADTAPASPRAAEPAEDAQPATAARPDALEPSTAAPRARAVRGRKPGATAGRRAAATSRPAVPAAVAAVLTGLVVGLFGAGATYGGTLGCEAWRGTSSCGGGPGLLLVIAILALMVLLGAGLLALLGVPEPRSTSFLGVGLTFVVVLVALMSAVFSVWMFFAVPVLSAVAYAAAHWVSTRHVELPEAGPEHDVR